jgi:hypothetical protein
VGVGGGGGGGSVMNEERKRRRAADQPDSERGLQGGRGRGWECVRCVQAVGGGPSGGGWQGSEGTRAQDNPVQPTGASSYSDDDDDGCCCCCVCGGCCSSSSRASSSFRPISSQREGNVLLGEAEGHGGGRAAQGRASLGTLIQPPPPTRAHSCTTTQRTGALSLHRAVIAPL